MSGGLFHFLKLLFIWNVHNFLFWYGFFGNIVDNVRVRCAIKITANNEMGVIGLALHFVEERSHLEELDVLIGGIPEDMGVGNYDNFLALTIKI